VPGGLLLNGNRRRKCEHFTYKKGRKLMELTRQELEAIVESDASFWKYIEEDTDQAPDGATVDLIQCAINQDGDAWDDYEMVQFIQEACQMFTAYSNRYVVKQ
jgi:hypothetical protein